MKSNQFQQDFLPIGELKINLRIKHERLKQSLCPRFSSPFPIKIVLKFTKCACDKETGSEVSRMSTPISERVIALVLILRQNNNKTDYFPIENPGE